MDGETLEAAITADLIPDRGGILTHYVIVAEWMDPETGMRYVSSDTSPQTVDWQRAGLLHHALYDEDWQDGDD